ncbi:hypothetical protein [Lacipirellula parvula]|uniref:Uncharacterized protein n=1 Tax=Lacipirellula parvula TaxID=2650471 RepID=A0A5K7XKI5_9BACT|nr:hypothetical protein [Lacipirellula parvula]BBO35681.1 hypothetical protein PLANPX_5293 [Lacipirellula parvula]
MTYLATLDGEQLGEITVGEPKPVRGSQISVPYRGQIIQAFVVYVTLNLMTGATVLTCLRPETFLSN